MKKKMGKWKCRNKKRTKNRNEDNINLNKKREKRMMTVRRKKYLQLDNIY